MEEEVIKLNNEEINRLPTHKYVRKISRKNSEPTKKETKNKVKSSVSLDGSHPDVTPAVRQNYRKTVYEEEGEEVVQEEWEEIRVLSTSQPNLNNLQLTTFDIDINSTPMREPNPKKQKFRPLSIFSKISNPFKKRNFQRSTPALNDIADEDSCCSICISDYQEGDDVKRLPCLHAFHAACVDNWLKESDSCPTCRLAVKESIYSPEHIQSRYGPSSKGS